MSDKAQINDSEPYDAAVVGAGIMGATTALFLARGGMRCALIDAGGVCREASGVNAGTLTLHMTRAALIPYAMRGWEMWKNAPNWLGSDPGVTMTDGLSLAFTAQEAALLEEGVEARRAQGAPIEIVTASRAREIEPGLTDKVRLVAHCPMDGHVTANLTGMAYRRALTEAGVRLYENAPVTGIEADNGGFRLTMAGVAPRARRLVLASGVWLEEMLAWFGSRIRIKALVNQLIVTERLRPVMRSVLGIASGFLSLKQFANGTVLIGGGWQGKGDRVRRVTEIVPDNLIGNLRLARYAVPALAETRIVRSWLGFEAETDDALPIVGPLSGIPEAYVIGCVHSGYTSGPYFGRLLAQTILGHEPEMPLFDAGRLLASP